MTEILKETLIKTLPGTDVSNIDNANINNNYNDKFDISYCPKCGDPITKKLNLLGKTRLVPVVCRCRIKELERSKEKLEFNKKKETLDRVFGTRLSAKNTKNISFENWNDDLGNVELKSLGYRYCNSFDAKFKGNIGFTLIGNAGVGKSYLSLCIAKEIEKKGYTVLAITISEILDKLRESYNSINGDAQLNKILVAINSADLLILDDLGVEPPSPWVNNVMYRLIDSRYCSKKPMIITTNLKNYDRYDEEGRISSRISEMCKPVVVNGDDIRKVIGKAKGLDITTNLNSSNNKIDEPYEKISDNADEEKIDYKRQVIIALNSCKNIFGEKAISDFSNKDIKYIEDRIKAAPNKIQALNGFINNLRNNSKSTKLREITLDYVKSIR